MFEQTFIEVKTNGKKPYTLLFSLLLQVAALGTLIILPLIYKQVLPQARLRSVFAAPIPPPSPMPEAKAPTSVRAASLRVFRIMPLPPVTPKDRSAEPSIGPPPLIPEGVPGGVSDSTSGGVNPIQVKPPDPPSVPVAKPETSKRVRVASMEASQLIHKVQPAYPSIAREIRVQGTVEFTAIISKTGAIENLQLLRGHPMLVAAARDAILQWRYKTTLLNGEPVEVSTNIVVNFTLNEQ
jgi:protein TonB